MNDHRRIPGEVPDERNWVHILDPNDTWTQGQLASWCTDDLTDLEYIEITEALYLERLLPAAMNAAFPLVKRKVETSMAKHGPVEEATIRLQDFDRTIKIVTMLLHRAGQYPSLESRKRLLKMRFQVAQHDIFAGRSTNADHQVTGTAVTGTKKGKVRGKLILALDPFGATGGSADEALGEYNDEDLRGARGIIFINMIVVPEYLERIAKIRARLVIPVSVVALRQDGGLTKVQYVCKPGGGDAGRKLSGLDDEEKWAH
ncbi:MAG: hypothetical protein Q7S66_00550 [bacterium]|nr:hypothetical protein [bacterium]